MINYILFAVTAAILFILFRVIRLLSFRIRGLKRFYALLVALELSVWMIFLFWLIQYFFWEKSYYNELILVLVVAAVILLVWFYIKDVVAGFLFRIAHNPSVGQLLYSDEADGIIKKMDASHMSVEHEGGEVIRVPYSRLLGKSLSLKTADARSASEVVFRIENLSTQDHHQLENEIRLVLLQSPWCVPNKPIRIHFLPHPDKGIEVALHLLDKSFTEAAKHKLTLMLTPTSNTSEKD
ncbi:MAG TPA: hypothetical protein VIS49_09000 [Cyclobacteriaceae bacterium]